MEAIEDMKTKKHNNLTINDICPNCNSLITEEPKNAHVLPKFILKGKYMISVAIDPNKIVENKGLSGKELLSGKFWCRACENMSSNIDGDMSIFFNNIDIDNIRQGMKKSKKYQEMNDKDGFISGAVLCDNFSYTKDDKTKTLNIKDTIDEFAQITLTRYFLYKGLKPIEIKNSQIETIISFFEDNSEYSSEDSFLPQPYVYNNCIYINLPKGIDVVYHLKNDDNLKKSNEIKRINHNCKESDILIQMTNMNNVNKIINCSLQYKVKHLSYALNNSKNP